MNPTEPNPIMEKSLTYYNYLHDKIKQNIIEAKEWKRPDIPFPKYTKPEKVKLTAGLVNFISQLKP